MPNEQEIKSKLKLPTLTDAQQLAYDEMWSLLIRAMPVLAGSEFKVLSMIFSDTYGLGQKKCLLAFRDFPNGYDDQRGWHGGCGVSYHTVKQVIPGLVADGLLRRFGKVGTAYRYQIVPSEFVAAIERRASNNLGDAPHPVRRPTRK